MYWVREDNTELGVSPMEGDVPMSSLAVPMMLLCLIDQLQTAGQECRHSDLEDWCVKEVKLHIQVYCEQLLGATHTKLLPFSLINPFKQHSIPMIYRYVSL